LIREINLAEVELNDHRALAGSGTFIHGNFRKWEPQARRMDGDLKMR
jgi:hypothetical protein